MRLELCNDCKSINTKDPLNTPMSTNNSLLDHEEKHPGVTNQTGISYCHNPFTCKCEKWQTSIREKSSFKIKSKSSTPTS